MAEIFAAGQKVRTTVKFGGSSSLPIGSIGTVKEVYEGLVVVLFPQTRELITLPNASVESAK